MVTPADIEAQILRYYHAEKWTIGTIARQLHVHHGVVRRVLAQAGLPRIGPPPRSSLIDAYLPFVRQTLEFQLEVCDPEPLCDTDCIWHWPSGRSPCWAV